MLSSRSLLVRLLLAVVGAVFLCLLIYFGLGWAVWTKQPWLVRIINYERWGDLFLAYARTSAAFLPADSDGDGVSDGLELYLHSDPHQPMSHPYFTLGYSNDDRLGRPWASAEEPGIIEMEYTILVSSELRTHVRRYLRIMNDPLPFPRGFRVQVRSVSDEVQIALPGGPLSSRTILVPVEPDGTIEFDLQARVQPPYDDYSHRFIDITTVDGSQDINRLSVRRVWPMGALAPEIEGASQEPLRFPKHSRDGTFPHIRLIWPAIATKGEGVLIEGHEDSDSVEWQPIAIFRTPSGSGLLRLDLRGAAVSEISPQHFRLTRVGLMPP